MVSIFEQHLATRRAAGLFDFSFMSLMEISGLHARSAVASLQTRSISNRTAGSVVYTLILDDDARVFIDATLWTHADDRWWLFTGRRSDVATLRKHADRFGAHVRDRSGELAILALQGPESGRMLARLVGEAIVRELRYFHFIETRIGEAHVIIARIGYSGELGYEILAPTDDGIVRSALLHLGAVECEFGAADSLRIESGYVLFDKEITGRENPFELGLERLVEMDGRDFIGSRALGALRRAPPAQRLVGFEISDRYASPLLPHARLTSECDSPILRRCIGLGFAGSELHEGTSVRLDDGRFATIARLPFYDAARRRPRGEVCLSSK